MDPVDHHDNKEGGEASSSEQTAGEFLRATRLERGLSVEEVARQLRLSVRQINALEEDDYGKFPSPTFLRGFARNYAKLLQVEAVPLLQSLQRSLPPPPAPAISTQIEGIPFPSDRKSGKRALVIVGVVLLALLLLFYEIYSGSEGQRENQEAVGKIETGMEAERVDVPSRFELPLSVPGEEPGSAPSANETGVEREGEMPAAVPAPSSALSPTLVPESSAPTLAPESESSLGSEPADDQDVLRLTFEGESWTEVKDARGKLLMSRINPSGTEQVLRGEPPFSLAIGNASQVRLVYNSKPVDLKPHISVYGGTARLSLE